MKRVVFLFGLVLLFQSAWVSANQQQRPLLVWLDFENVEAQRSARLRYKNILEKAFNRPVTYSQNSDNFPEIRLIDRPQEEKDDDWITGNYLIDVIPAFSLIKLRDHTLPQVPLVGVIRRPYFYPYKGTRSPLDDMNLAINMLANKRLDMILDYERDSAFYSQLQDNVEIIPLSTPKNIRVLFRNLQQTLRFNQALSEIAGIKENIDNIIEDVASSPPKQEDVDGKFTWLMIAKYFDEISNELVVTNTDTSISIWLQNQLSQFDFSIEQTNVSNGFERLAKDPNACIVNTTKSKGREALAYYSLPTYVFLDYHLYAVAGTSAQKNLEKWYLQHARNPVEFSTFFDAYPATLFGYSEYLNRTANYAKSVKNDLIGHPERFIKIKTRDRIRNLTLLRRKRVDYLIAFPFVMFQTVNDQSLKIELKSYPIKHFDTPYVSYIACAKSPEGKNLTDKINGILRIKENRNRLKKLINHDMLPADQAAFSRAFDKVLSEASQKLQD